MSSQLQKSLQALADSNALHTLGTINRGIEKESLRITGEGKLAQTPHPHALGAALTHGSITTDYSEALLEFITPVSTSIAQSIETLEDIHSFVYQSLDDEMLWCTSMPCIVSGDAGIPVARYGSSNVARMKTVYRYGLGHRYGRLMQAIAGIHYNWSMPDTFWQSAWESAGKPGTRQDYITERYLGLIRNFRRLSWLLIYLFGASPAVCSSFLKGRENHGLQSFDASGRSLYMPYGTALRMGDLGYNSDAQKGLNICYNSLANYVETLRSAILQPHAAYADIPSGENGDYQQLSHSLLQIENEFYSPIRPKRVARSGETALSALVRGGIEYVEVRCVDVSPFSAVGLDDAQIRFIDTFLLYCLLEDSPLCTDEQQTEVSANLGLIVNRGREPGLQLSRDGSAVARDDWAMQLLDAMQPVAALFDEAEGHALHGAALQAQRSKVEDPELTPSARILREMREQDLPFMRLAMAYSERWASYFKARELPAERYRVFTQQTLDSHARQLDIEAADTQSFEDYLQSYFDQYRDLRVAVG
ncbi:MAG: glutamate--cysteine ligase [Gammaproteobacteria bacterium]|nr:glutamate--cysteine ligase [Gammaproteobacteria bacterium]